jgi:hypothetical protein
MCIRGFGFICGVYLWRCRGARGTFELKNCHFRLGGSGYNLRMESPKMPSGPDVERLIVPEALLQQVHDAHERFHAAKEALKGAMDSTDYDHTQHVNERYAELRKAEKEVEELNEKVQEILRRKV